VWPFLGLYGLWLWRRDREARVAVAAAAAIVPVLWFGPDVIGVGGALTASDAARGTPSAGSAALASVPALAVLGDAATLLTVPATLAAIVGAVTGPRPARILGIAAAGWVVIVAVMTQAGYAGNPRYLVAAASIGCALAGVGAARAGAALTRAGPGPAVAAVVVVLATAIVTRPDLSDQLSNLGVRADRHEALPELVAAAGGRDALLRCAPVRTAGDVRPFVAWELDLPMLGINDRPHPPVVLVRWRPYDDGPFVPPGNPADEGYRLLARAPGWEAWGVCG
jgi:hypothetical protein